MAKSTSKKTATKEPVPKIVPPPQAEELKIDELDEIPKIYYPVVRNVQTNDFYKYIGENKFQNIRTKAEGEVPSDKASVLFRINVDATKMFNEYPLVQDLVNKLNLTFDNNQNQTK